MFGGLFSIFIQIGDPDQTLRSAASDLGLHYLPMSHKREVVLIWVKIKHEINAIKLI